jgi:hypothetical protein
LNRWHSKPLHQKRARRLTTETGQETKDMPAPPKPSRLQQPHLQPQPLLVLASTLLPQQWQCLQPQVLLMLALASTLLPQQWQCLQPQALLVLALASSLLPQQWQCLQPQPLLVLALSSFQLGVLPSHPLSRNACHASSAAAARFCVAFGAKTAVTKPCPPPTPQHTHTHTHTCMALPTASRPASRRFQSTVPVASATSRRILFVLRVVARVSLDSEGHMQDTG